MEKEIGKIPPHATDAEEAVLGALMLEQDAFYKVSQIIDVESFYKQSNGIIYAAIKRLAGKSPIDFITISEELRSTGELELIGGLSYIVDMTKHIATAAHIEEHAKIIAQKHIQRELIRIGFETTNEAFDTFAEVEELLSNLKMKITTIENSTAGCNAGQIQDEVIEEALEEIDIDCKIANTGKQPGINTGLFELNRATGGWRNTNLIILAARPGIGKTSLALHFAKSAALTGKWVNFYGMEMKSSDLMRIMISGESGVNRTALRDGQLSEDDWSKINDSTNQLHNLPIIWNDFAGLKVGNIEASTIRNRKNGKCDLIIIDYIQLLQPTDKKQNREQQIAEMSRSLKRLALNENIPVIALAQLNREAETGKPLLSHLRESGSLEQDADIVIFPWNDYSTPGYPAFNLTIAKNRRGIKGTFEIIANSEMTRFNDK